MEDHYTEKIGDHVSILCTRECSVINYNRAQASIMITVTDTEVWQCIKNENYDKLGFEISPSEHILIAVQGMKYTYDNSEISYSVLFDRETTMKIAAACLKYAS